jgi:hypothetical protein
VVFVVDDRKHRLDSALGRIHGLCRPPLA